MLSFETNPYFSGWKPETGEAALLTGGEDGYNSYLSSSVLYPGGCSVPSMESGRYGHVTFLTQDFPPRITTCGGNNNQRDCLVLKNGGWMGGEVDDLPDQRYLSASARLDVGVFILGGDSPSSSSSVFLRANSRSWVQGPQLPVAMKYGPCAAPISAHSFLIVYKTDVYEFDTRVGGPTSSDGWKTTWPQLQVSRKYQPGCAVLGTNRFIVAGGYNGNYLKSTEIINLETKTIEFGGEMEKPRGYFHLLSISGSIHALGGRKGGSLADVEEFVEEPGTWKPATSLPGGRSQYGGLAVNLDLVCG